MSIKKLIITSTLQNATHQDMYQTITLLLFVVSYFEGGGVQLQV